MERNKADLAEAKIGVVGAGGVGGYLAAMLADAYPHVTVVARGKRGEAIRKQGLVLHSEHRDEKVSRPEAVAESAGELSNQDIIFICVKNYSLEEVCRELKDCVTEDTVLVPVMNGADPGDRVRQILGKGIVVDSLIYIVAFAGKDYSITQQGDFADIRVGTAASGQKEQEAVEFVCTLLQGARVDCRAAKDIEREIWRKYILNCAYNVETAYYDNTIGQLREDQKKHQEYIDLVEEAWQVAVAKGVHVTRAHADAIIRRFEYELADNATSSLQRDIRDGKTNELDTFCGYLIREAGRLGVDVPVTRKMYQGLLGK